MIGKKGPIITLIEGRSPSTHRWGGLQLPQVCLNGTFPWRNLGNVVLMKQFLQGNVPFGHPTN